MVKRTREDYMKLANDYQNLRISYDCQVYKNVALEAKVKELAIEIANQNFAWDVFDGTNSFDFDLANLQVTP
jgi:hypothetical protein